MKRIFLSTAQGKYPILIGQGLISRVGMLAKEYGRLRSAAKVLIVTNRQVAQHYLSVVKKSFEKIASNVFHFVLPFGDERDKSEPVLKRLWERMAVTGLERTSIAVALGGGVVGDLTGFAASTYMRGIPLVQVPTTLLAQVDSAIGGKTGIDLKFAKNMIGSFYQPRLVVSDVLTSVTLASENFVNSFAEVIKYGMIWDKTLFQSLERRAALLVASHRRSGLSENDFLFLEDIVYRSASAKAKVVSQDVFETQGIRMILNYGHTFGHALETASKYQLSHGEAVALGMVFAARLARRLGMLSEEDEKRQRELIKKVGLPTQFQNQKISSTSLIQLMKRDKKVRNGELRFVLPESIGHVLVREGISEEEIKKTLLDLRKN